MKQTMNVEMIKKQNQVQGVGHKYICKFKNRPFNAVSGLDKLNTMQVALSGRR